jgi:hypothetical protein
MNPRTFGLGVLAGVTLAFVAGAALLMWSAAKAATRDPRRRHDGRWSG